MVIDGFGMETFGKIDEFQHKISAVDNVDAVRPLVDQALADLGFSHFAFSLIDAAANPRSPFLLTNYPTEWRAHYDRAGLSRHDPIFRNALDTVRPALWRDCDRRYAISTSKRLVFGPSADFGLRHGGGMGSYGPAGQLANLQVAGDGTALTFDDLFREHRHVLYLLMIYTHDRVLRFIDGPRPDEVSLTARQREVLLWAVRGKTYWEIGEILDIAEDTVRQHTHAACRRLNASTRTQAVALAISRGLISPYGRRVRC